MNNREAPINWHEQLKLDCYFCREHEQGDVLYELIGWEGGLEFKYIRDIKYCPVCGRELLKDE